ncbi:MAG TPA: hypothetical protein VMU35_06895 [Methylomirabilota bacterium]|nr:hypothetical protein [Methylomirabilota bacterium]
MKASKLGRLSFVLLNLVRKEESGSILDENCLVLRAKYPIQDLHEEYSSAEYSQ